MMSMKMPMKTRQSGLTLLEVLVALVAGLIVIGGVIQVYLADKHSYRVTEGYARLQENARYAMEFLARDIRMAGYFGCGGEERQITNTLNDQTGFNFRFGTPVEGNESTGAAAWSPALPAGFGTVTPASGTDVVTIRGVLDEGILITGQPSNPTDCNNSSSHTANIKVTDGSSFTVDEIVLATNCTSAAIFQITSKTGGGDTIVHNTGASVPGNSTKNLGACFADDGELVHPAVRSYFIGIDGTGTPVLYRKDFTPDRLSEPLIDNVEQMQLLYGLDSTGDGDADKFLPASEVTDWTDVDAVRVTLVLRSADDGLTGTPQPYSLNGAVVTPTDRRLRRTYTSTIALRNRLP